MFLSPYSYFQETLKILTVESAASPIPSRDGSWFSQRGIPCLFSRFPFDERRPRSREGLPLQDNKSSPPQGETLVEMHDVCVKYGDKLALGGWKQEIDGTPREGLWWTVRRGERWGVFGPNGQ